MIEHDDVPLETDRRTLLALTDSITGIGIDSSTAEPFGQGVWIVLRDGECLQFFSEAVTPAFKFEVFPLAITGIAALRARMIAARPALERSLKEADLDWPLPPIPDAIVSPVPIEPWQEDEWTLEVLERREWLADPDAMGPDLVSTADLPPGAVPRGTEHACLVALGLLFSFRDGKRLLVASGEFPCTLIAIRDNERIDAFLKPCFRVEAHRYAEALRD